jgi:hypothetical protein
MRNLALALSAAFLLLGCTQNKIIRPQAQVCELKAEQHAAEGCAQSSIEDYGDYALAFVEFDDQGWFYDRSQMTRLMDMLWEEAEGKAEARDLILFVYVHGWKHNADVCDYNVACTREVLKQIASVEKLLSQDGKIRPQRKAVGIYVGWRGLSNTGPELWRNISFYTRKNAATHVAQGSVRELLARLKEFQDQRNRSGGETRLFTLGHSFGGLIVYHAIAQSMMEAAVPARGAEANEVVTPYGDLVVLVNPAFEASRFHPLHEISSHRSNYKHGQYPVLVALTSENDLATKTAFPLGRRVSSVFQKFVSEEEKSANLNTMGHVPHYRTHSLRLADGAETSGIKPSSSSPCACPIWGGRLDLSKVSPGEESKAFKSFHAQRATNGGELPPGWRREFTGGAILSHEQYHPENPFWVVSVDPRIIHGHNEFYSPALMHFLRQLYDDALREPVKLDQKRRERD